MMTSKTWARRLDSGVVRIFSEVADHDDGAKATNMIDILPSDFVKIVRDLTENDGEMRVHLARLGADAEEIAHVKTNGLGR